MVYPPLARVRQSIPQPRHRRRARYGPPLDPWRAGCASGSLPAEQSPSGSAAAGFMASIWWPGPSSTRYVRWVTSRSSSPRWGATAARPPKASASFWPVTASPSQAMGVAGQDRHGHRRAGHQSRRSADLFRQERLRGRRHRPGQSGQAAHRLPRDARVGRAQDAGHRPGQARGGQPGPQAGRSRLARGPAGRRAVPGQEHAVRPGPGDRRKCRGRPGRNRRPRARDDLRRRAGPARACPAA